MKEGAPALTNDMHEAVERAPSLTPEQISKRVAELADALDEAIAKLHESTESKEQTTLEGRAEAARELAGSIEQEYEAQTERFETVSEREEYKALQTLAALNEMGQALARAYGAAADAELSAGESREHVAQTASKVMQKLATIGSSSTTQAA